MLNKTNKQTNNKHLEKQTDKQTNKQTNIRRQQRPGAKDSQVVNGKPEVISPRNDL